MLPKDKEKYWEELEQAHEQTVEAWGNKKLRELVVFGEFLSRIQMEFDESEIKQPEKDPPDVIFQDHNFEIIFSPGNREPHKEAKNELKGLKEDKNKHEIRYVNLKMPTKLSFSEIVKLVEHDLTKKSLRYASPQLKSSLNILFNIMQNKFPDIVSPFPDLHNLVYHGWQSVTVMISSYAIVLFANDLAPDFLKSIVQKPFLSPSPQWWTPKCWKKM